MFIHSYILSHPSPWSYTFSVSILYHFPDYFLCRHAKQNFVQNVIINVWSEVVVNVWPQQMRKLPQICGSWVGRYVSVSIKCLWLSHHCLLFTSLQVISVAYCNGSFWNLTWPNLVFLSLLTFRKSAYSCSYSVPRTCMLCYLQEQGKVFFYSS